MVSWLFPAALLGLIAAAGPIVVHLLRRQRAPRVPFASLRFVRSASTSAVRMRLPSDLWLLILRVTIVSGAAVALGQPLLLTPARRAAWNERVSRAVIVDTSESMPALTARAQEARSVESRHVTFLADVSARDLRDGLSQAVDALSAAPPSRREIVVISDFQNGSLVSSDVALVPNEIGLRFVDLGSPMAATVFDGERTMGTAGVGARVQRIEARPDGTFVRLEPADSRLEGLRLMNAREGGDAVLRTVARSGVPAPSASEPIALVFGSSKAPANRPNGGDRMHAWMLRTILRMRADGSLTEAAREHLRAGAELPGAVVARDGRDVAVVSAMALGQELVLFVAGEAEDYLSAATLRSALIARRGDMAWTEHDSLRIPGAQLALWTREPAPVDATGDRIRFESPGDARWAWALVLALLGCETLARNRHRREKASAYADAA